MSFLHIIYKLPDFREYLREVDVNSCLKGMLEAKKGGKVLFKFFKKAVKKDIWKNDEIGTSFLNGCIEKVSKLDKKYREKFTKHHKIFNEKVRTFAAAQEQAAALARAAREQEAARRAAAHPTEQRHLATIGQKVKEPQRTAYNRLVACFLEENCQAVPNEENGIVSTKEIKKARYLFNVSAEPLSKTYRALLLVAHPDKWASEPAIAKTADDFIKFLNHYRNNAV